MKVALILVNLLFGSVSAQAAELAFANNDFATKYNRAAMLKALRAGLTLAGCNTHGQIVACSYPISDVLRMTSMGSSAQGPSRAVYLEFSGTEKDKGQMDELARVAAAMAWAITPDFSGSGTMMLDLLNDTADKPQRRVGNVRYEVEIAPDGKVWFKATAL